MLSSFSGQAAVLVSFEVATMMHGGRTNTVRHFIFDR